MHTMKEHTMDIRRLVAVTVATASLGVGALAFTPAAGAQTTTDPSARKEQACQRAHNAWEKLVAANDKAVARYHELRDKQAELLANGHEQAAHRLDVRLDAARHRHERIKDRVLAIAARVKDYCSEQPPVIAEP
jgi:transposase